jgi:hypothetical protein
MQKPEQKRCAPSVKPLRGHAMRGFLTILLKKPYAELDEEEEKDFNKGD